VNLAHLFASYGQYVIIAVALTAGLAASYGREREAQQTPGRGWWLNRLLILPLLAIATSAAAEAFKLTEAMSALAAAMLSLGGYDAVRVIEKKWRKRADRSEPQ
jgi:cell division septum initiation protein DivIVA